MEPTPKFIQNQPNFMGYLPNLGNSLPSSSLSLASFWAPASNNNCITSWLRAGILLKKGKMNETTQFLIGIVVFWFSVWNLHDHVTENLILHLPIRELHKLSQNHPILQGFSWISAADLHVPMPRCTVQQRFMNFRQIGIPRCSQQRFQGGHVVVPYGHGQVAILFFVGRPEIQLHELNLAKLTRENLRILHFSGTIFHEDPRSCFSQKIKYKNNNKVKKTLKLHQDQQLCCCDLP